jgi:hypothetical protein
MTPTTPTNLDHDERRRVLDADRRKQLVDNARRLDAELSVLTIYDDERRSLGYDYGNGQRFTELIRVRRERDAAVTRAHTFGYGMGLGDLLATPELVRDAYRRISTAKLRRLYAAQAHYRTRSGDRAVAAWAGVGREVERILADPGLIRGDQ